MFLALVVLAAACAGCGGSGRPKTLLAPRGTVVALALRGSDVAWLAGRGVAGCDLSLWLERSKTVERLRLPSHVAHTNAGTCFDFTSTDSATLALAGGYVGWSVDDEGGDSGVVTEGASSARPSRAATFAVELTDGPGNYPEVGTLLGGVTATDDAVLWGTARRLLRRLSFRGRVEATRTKLVLWNDRRLLVVDPRSGQRRTIVTFAAPPSSGTGFYWSVTAVAADGNRLAWAQTTNLGVSIVRTVRVA